MALLRRETGCCGEISGKDEISVLSLVTLSVPLFYLCGLISLVARIIPFAKNTQIVGNSRILARASFRMIYEKKLYPILRCKVAAAFYRLSPRVSGVGYRYFNLVVLSGPFYLAVILFAGVLF